MLKGIAASSGVVVAKAYKLEQPTINVVRRSADVEKEIANFKAALVKTQRDIEIIKTKAIGKLTDDELAIFDAHIMVTQDPEFTGQMEEMIRNESINADFACQEVSNMFINMFETMDDPYFRERAADIKDVSYRLQCHILGLIIPDLSLINEEVIIVANDLTPSDTAQLNKAFTKGFATQIGGRTSHSAIMARSLEIPAVVGINGLLKSVNHGDMLVLDAIDGFVMVNPEAQDLEHYRNKAKNFAELKASLKIMKDAESITLDAHKVELVGNIGTPNDVEGVLSNGGEGVGLYRTEFLYMDATALPTEEDQYEAYKTVLEKMGKRPVVVRTLDIGGDKVLSYLPFPHEMNPFLGYRAIRLCLDRPDIFKTQARALLRASVYGHLCIMFPMIATLGEFRAAKQFILDTDKELRAEGIAVSDDYEIGMMVEIPASAILADQFAKEADFFSIGTNDLVQYSMAADRMSEKVAYLYQPLNPSLLRLIKMTIDGAHSQGKWCGMCGEMAGDELAAPVLLGLGLDEFSMSASSILQTRKMIRSLKYKDMKIMAEKALKLSTMEEVVELVKASI
ncbi:MAG: phosphoenolpyruvate--protein phosphotransferase [Erysipelotrichaceae bacterium]|nr:phosphoenolpyruvate--protein phosphotransferase [Erysipelotrichaceae bacterium]